MYNVVFVIKNKFYVGTIIIRYVSTMTLNRIRKFLVFPAFVVFILFGYYVSRCAIDNCFDEESENLSLSNTYLFERTPNSREYWKNRLARYLSNSQLLYNGYSIFLDTMIYNLLILLFIFMQNSGIRKTKTLIFKT